MGTGPQRSQFDKFKELACEVESKEDEEAFDRALCRMKNKKGQIDAARPILASSYLFVPRRAFL